MENKFWLNTLKNYYYNEQDFANFNKFDDIVKSISLETIKEMASKYIDDKSFVQIVLMPEKSE